MEKGRTIHVICNTHWDREWVYPFRETQLLLIEFMDHLLDVLDRRPDYHSFLMDSQTLCVEDYLELRPESRERVERHVKSGRLLVGPWYSLPEEYIVNGESLVRNLVFGHRVAGALGKVMKLGYTPFSYGQTSQMPQIYNGFDIDTIIFYRGINTPKSEFVMEGPDGSRVLGCRFGALSRFSFFFYIYRRCIYNKTRDDWRYEWNRGALPFRLCGEACPGDHYYVLDPQRQKMYLKDLIPQQIRRLVEDEAQHFTTSQIAAMQGFDSSEPDPMEPDLIAECQKHIPEHKLIQSSLDDYFKAMRKEVRDPFVIRGESRDPGAVGKWVHLMGDVLSSRTRTKRLNAQAETMLQRWAEPFAALAWSLGAEYPQAAFDLAWRYLLKSHPHDTICGAGIDQMEKDMVHYLEQCQIISKGLMRRGMQHIQRRINTSDLPPDESVLTVFNPSPFPRSEVVTLYLDLPDDSNYEDLSIADVAGKTVPLQEVSRYPQGTLVRNLLDISLELRSTRIKAHFLADDIPALGYRTYHVSRKAAKSRSHGDVQVGVNSMENSHLHVQINSDGTLRITHKPTGRVFDGLHYFEDSGEVGHSWIHMSPPFDEIITSHGVPVDIAREEAGPLLARYRIDYRMSIPVGVHHAPDGVHRSAERRELPISSWLTLRSGSRFVEVTTRFENQCMFHRLRVMFPSQLAAAVSCAEASFDVVERKIVREPGTPYFGRENPTYPNHRFVDVSDGKVGIAILNDGLREYEVKDTPDRTIALTLMRGYEFRQSPVIDRWSVHPEMLLAQSLGPHEFRYAIYPHAGAWDEGEVVQEAEKLCLPLQAAQAGPHDGDLPKEMSFIRVQPESLALSALKHCEHRQSLVMRIFNPTARAVRAKITCAQPIRAAYLTNLNEERRERLQPKGRALSLPVPRKKIVTLELTLSRPAPARMRRGR
jgi:hypothetical protein